MSTSFVGDTALLTGRSMRHITQNIAAKLTAAATNGTAAFETITDTQPQSAVTRRIESPTDWRL